MLSFLNINFDSFFRYFLSVLRDTDTCSIAYVCQKTNRSFQTKQIFEIPNTKKKKNDTPEQPTQSPHTHIENRTSPKPNTLSLSLSVHTTNYTNYQNTIYIYISTKSLVYPQNKTHISHLCIAETC